MPSTDLQRLTDFCVKNTELEELETLLAEFNIFEAAGMGTDEIRHSRFLSFLLNPRESHGLGDSFLTRFLQAAVSSDKRSNPIIPALELELLDLSDCFVGTENHNIDILILAERPQIAVVIENKIRSTEHSEQLEKYWEYINRKYSNWRVLGVFLTPEGLKASHEDYLVISYEEVAQELANILKRRSNSIGTEIQFAISHYIRLLRRKIVKDAKLEELCLQIIRKHSKALELIFSYRTDIATEIRKAAEQLVINPDEFEVESNRLFLPKKWLSWVPKSSETSWMPSGYAMAFQFKSTEKGLRLDLNLGPGPRNQAQAFLDVATSTKHPFDAQSKNVSGKWNIIYRKVLVLPQTLEERDIVEALGELERNWKQVIEHDLPQIGELLCKAADQLKS